MTTLKKKVLFIVALLTLSISILLPNFKSIALPDWYPFGKIRLGLDLRGGTYLILGVKTEEAVNGHLASLVTNIRSELRDKRVGLIRARQINGTSVEFHFISSSNLDEIKLEKGNLHFNLKVSLNSPASFYILIGGIKIDYTDQLNASDLNQWKQYQITRDELVKFGVNLNQLSQGFGIETEGAWEVGIAEVAFN
jgi:preprotein translocase subunit SecD